MCTQAHNVDDDAVDRVASSKSFKLIYGVNFYRVVRACITFDWFRLLILIHLTSQFEN